jgi:hypothetical protein
MSVSVEGSVENKASSLKDTGSSSVSEENELEPLVELEKKPASCSWGYAHLELQGAFWYFVASFGYVIYDVLFGVFPLYCGAAACLDFVESDNYDWLNNFLAVFFASAYMLDAVIYWLALIVHEPKNAWKTLYWSSEMVNTVASVLYLVSQIMYYHSDFEATTLEPLLYIAVAQSVVYLVGNLLWSINSIQYYLIWHQDREEDSKRHLFRQMGFWAETWNIWPCLGYTITSLWALVAIYSNISDFETLKAFWDNNQALQLVINIAWDVGFSVDAVLYALMWNNDRKDVYGK